MKYQLKVLNYLLLKKYKKLLLLILFFLICMVVITYINPIEITVDIFNALIGIVKIEKYTFLDWLWNIFQVVVIFFLSYHFFSYEEDNSIEFLILRKNYNTFLLNKLIISLVMIAIFRFIIYMVLYLSFQNFISFSYNSLLVNIVNYFLVVIISFVFYILKKNLQS